MYAIFKSLVASLVLWGHVAAAEPEWRQKLDRHGIKVYQQHLHPKYRQWHSKGTLKVEASVASVLALLKDLPACSEWVYGCLSASRTNDDLIHMVFKGPLWFKDRDVIFSTEVQQRETDWLIVVQNQPHLHAGHDYVRVKNMEASWHIKPVGENELMITYLLYMDPETGFKSGVNKYNRDTVYLTLKNMRVMLQKAAYKNATL